MVDEKGHDGADQSGKMIRVDMQTIAKSGRNTSGVYIVKGDDVASI